MGAVSFSPTFFSLPKSSLKPLLFSPLSTPVPSKPTKRKNYLRPKILKNIPKPLPSSTPVDPVTPVESSPETKPVDVFAFELTSDEVPREVLEETNTVEEFQVSETAGVAGDNTGSFGKISAYSVVKFGFYFVGIFLFQTLIAVWVMGNGNSQDKGEYFDGYRGNKNKNGKFLNNGRVGSRSKNAFYWDDSELEQKVEEIRAMAREAREIEEKELKNSNEEGDMVDESLNSTVRVGIEKEIDAKLNYLEKKLSSKRDNLPGSYMSFLNTKLKDVEDAKEMNKKLFIKKKFKFRGHEKNSTSGAKGFPGIKGGSPSRNKNATATSSSGAKEVDGGKRVVSQNSDLFPSNGEKTEEIEELGALHSNTRFESSQERLKVRDMDSKKPQIFTKENQVTRTKSDEHSSKYREACNMSPANEVNDKQSGIGTDTWWLKLPYVLGILMRRGVDHEGPEGLFTLRISSEGQEQSESSCAVAFEDHSDAKNFCYLLECFFEDLGDFSTEVAPMSVKELYEAIKSHAKNVIVVKKGQLKLYAGQPFAEVEMALHSLIEDNRRASIANSE